MTLYKYEPGFLDKSDPCIIYGEAIKPGATVMITKPNVDPMKMFVFITDKEGNRQSVFRKSLVKQG